MVQLKRRGILKRRLVLIGAAALGLIATLVPASPTAQAAAAPWTWTRVTVPVSVQANSSYAIRALCPSGFTAITGGLALPNFSSVVTQGQYRQDDTSGSGWSVIFRNFSSSTGSATVVAECAETADLPPISYQIQEFSRDGNGWAEGEVPCPNAGEVVLTGGVDWSNTIPDKSIYASAPGWGETSWYGYGHNSGTGAKLGVEVYCVNPAYVPGFVKIEHTQGGDWVVDTLTCPVGKRILNGGGLAYTYASFPNRTSWTTTSSGTRTTRAMCIDAGSPTISIDFASPGPDGSVTKSAYANFALSGSDPAGFPNSFRCSIDGGSPSVCGSSAGFGPLSPGPHELVVWNATSDGRTSGVRTYEWTSDQTGPTVTPPKIPKVILGVSAKAQWSATDDYSGVKNFDAAYNLIHIDATSTGWKSPKRWRNLTEPSIRTPDLSQGESLCVSVRAKDGVGNDSAWSEPACTSRPLDDRALTATTGWSRLTGADFWLNTITRTTAVDQTLTRSNVRMYRVGIVASQCPGCGAVVVKLGTTRIGRINLDATALTHRQVRLLPGLGEVSGDVTVTSVTSGQQISIDGLVVMQRVYTLPN